MTKADACTAAVPEKLPFHPSKIHPDPLTTSVSQYRPTNIDGVRATPQRVTRTSMRRPVDVKSFCDWVSSCLKFSFARILGGPGLARRRSRPRSEFTGALTGAAASHSWSIRAKENTRMLLSRHVFTTLEPGLGCRPPFHPYSS